MGVDVVVTNVGSTSCRLRGTFRAAGYEGTRKVFTFSGFLDHDIFDGPAHVNIDLAPEEHWYMTLYTFEEVPSGRRPVCASFDRLALAGPSATLSAPMPLMAPHESGVDCADDVWSLTSLDG